MTPPWFVVHLPQRAAAFAVVNRFAQRNDLPAPEISEHLVTVRHPRGHEVRQVQLRAITPDGRRYGVSYEWTGRDIERYVPRVVQPNHTCPTARWPADITCPPRVLRRLGA